MHLRAEGPEVLRSKIKKTAVQILWQLPLFGSCIGVRLFYAKPGFRKDTSKQHLALVGTFRKPYY